MDQPAVDLRREQQNSLARPRYKYSVAARLFFLSMDVLTGVRTTLPKAKLVEILASVPYRAWEQRQYARMTWHYRDRALVERARAIMAWAREAQDNEYWHLLVLNEKMSEDGIADPRYLAPPIPFLMVTFYRLLTWAMALVDIRRAFLFNAEFEDHAEHVYAKLVADHPEWEREAVVSDVVRRYSQQATWADVFRRVGLDERDHMNMSFLMAGRPQDVVTYAGMPSSHDPAVWRAGA